MLYPICVDFLYILDLHFVLFLLTVHNKRICYAVLWGLVLYLCCISYTNWMWLPVLSRKLAITGSYFCTRCHLSTFVAKIKTLLSGVNMLIKHFANDVTERLNINKVVKSINFSFLASVRWRCWLGGRKGIRPVKNWVVGCWRGCLELGADLHMAQQMPLPRTVTCFSKIQIGCTFLVPAHPGSPGKRAVTRVCYCRCCWD